MFTVSDVDRALTNALKSADFWFRRGVPSDCDDDSTVIFEYKRPRHGLARVFGQEKCRLVVTSDSEGVCLLTSDLPEVRFYPCCRPEVPEFLEAHLPAGLRVIDPVFPGRDAKDDGKS